MRVYVKLRATWAEEIGSCQIGSGIIKSHLVLDQGQMIATRWKEEEDNRASKARREGCSPRSTQVPLPAPPGTSFEDSDACSTGKQGLTLASPLQSPGSK